MSTGNYRDHRDPGDQVSTIEQAETVNEHVPLALAALPPPVTDFGPVRLELMGHRYREGRLSEVVIAGQPFLRLDLAGGAVEYYAPSSVYCISPGMSPVPLAAIPERFNDVLDDGYDNDDGGPF